MISLVVCSHSRELAEAAVRLAEQMVPAPARPMVAVAAGDCAGGLGTDPTAVMSALEDVATPDGVLVLVDLGSAVMSAEMGVELAALDVPVVVSAAPLVEGLVVAMVAASSGAPLAAVDVQARGALEAKIQHLTQPTASSEHPGERETSEGVWHELQVVIDDPFGLHLRPASALVHTIADLDVEIEASKDTAERDWVDALSVIALTTLGIEAGSHLVVRARGPQADDALASIKALADRGFRETEVDLAAAVEQVCGLFEGQGRGPRARAIMQAIPALVRDQALLGSVRDRLVEGESPVDAVTNAAEALAERFSVLPGALSLRAQDVRMVGRLLAAAVDGAALPPPLPEPGTVLDELDCLTAVRLDPSRYPSVLVRAEGNRAHGPIIAREAGIRVTTGVKD